MLSNYQLIERLEDKVKDNNTRYELIFLATSVGSYRARETNPNNFREKRQISGAVVEAEYITQTVEYILSLLGKKSIDNIIKELYKELKELKEKNLPESWLSIKLYKIDNNSVIDAGKRIEKKILESKKLKTRIEEREKMINYFNKKFPKIKYITVRETKNIFNLEADIISSALCHKIEEMKRDKY